MQYEKNCTIESELIETLSTDGSIRTQLIRNHKSGFESQHDASEKTPASTTLGLIMWEEEPDGAQVALRGMELSLGEAHRLQLALDNFFVDMMKEDPDGWAHLMAGDID